MSWIEDPDGVEEPEPENISGKTMCEYIAKSIKETIGTEIDPVRVWNYSATGELSLVFEWYGRLKECVDSEEKKELCLWIVDAVCMQTWDEEMNGTAT